MFREVAKDIDAITETGYYCVSNGISTNIPPNAYSYGVLEVFGGVPFIGQRYTPHSDYAGNYGEYSRVRYNGTWTSWRFIPYNK